MKTKQILHKNKGIQQNSTQLTLDEGTLHKFIQIMKYVKLNTVESYTKKIRTNLSFKFYSILLNLTQVNSTY